MAHHQCHHCSQCNQAGYEWIDSSVSRSVPSMAVQVGVDRDGHAIFIGRAHFNGELTPVHVVPMKRVAYVANYGKEHHVDNYQILCVNYLRWIPSQGGHVPPGAVQAGHNKDGAPLYVGRAYYGGSQIIGKVHPKLGTCFLPYNGKEVTVQSYEVLVKNL